MPFWKPSLSPTRILVALSICVGSTVSLPLPAAACQAGNPACVLPVRDPAPVAPPPSAAPAPIVDDDGGFGIWPFIIGLAALAALILLLSGGGDGEEPPVSP